MNLRLGDALLEKGLVSAEQLDAALEKQCDLGGTLGANLLELGFVDEEELGQALAEQLGVRYAPAEMLRYISREARAALPRPLLWKHRAVPFRLDGNTLHVLVSDVRNLAGLSTRTGYRVVPWLAPELRVHRELARHFKIPMSPRYSEIVQRLEQDSATGDAAGSDETIDRPLDGGRPAFAERLVGAQSADDAARIVLDEAAQQLDRCILFRVTDGEARVWDLRGHSLHPDDRASFVVPALSGSPLELLVIHPVYRGKVPDERAYRPFFTRLDLSPPSEIVLVPIKVAGQLVAILYGDGAGSGEIRSSLAEQRRLGRKLELTLTMLLLRRKILE